MSVSYTEFGPPTKRLRDDLESHIPEISKHDKLYFENGTIVLFSFPKNNVIKAYKVYKDLLVRCSSVFEGMFSVPLPPNMKRYDGVPLFRLPDEATDLTPFLEAIYNQTAFPSERDFFATPDKIASIFKLSKRYQSERLLESMKDTLMEIWPRSLWSWDDITKNNQGVGGLVGEDHDILAALPEPCSAIRLARDYDIPAILPTAFYHLLRTLPHTLSHTVSEAGGHWGQDKSSFGTEAHLASLSQHDFMCFVRGSYAIRNFVGDLQSDAISHAYRKRPRCGTRNACFESLETFAWKHKAAAHWKGDPLETLQEHKIRSLNPGGICNGCLTHYINYMEDSRQQLWNSLPTFFGLESS